MSSRLKTTSKKVIPSESVFSETSEDDLLGKGDGPSKKLRQKNLKKKPATLPASEVQEGHEKAKTQISDVTESGDAENFPSKQNSELNPMLAQVHRTEFFALMLKKDHQIEVLSESVSCMAKEIQKLNTLIAKLQEQVMKSQENNSSTSKGVHNIPFSKVLQPEGKKNGSLSEKTPLATVPSVPAKKTVKFADVVKRDVVKTLTPETPQIEGTVEEIKSSCWKGKDLSYLLMFDSGVEKWVKSSDCTSIQGMLNEFHKQNPGAPNAHDYSLADSLKTDNKRKKAIMSKIKKNNSRKLQSDEIEFIASSLVKESGKPKEFAKVSFSITNKRVFKGFTYAQKKNTLQKITHQYGINQKVVRISLVGDSILELYTLSEEKEMVTARMKSNGWNQVEFNPEDLPDFASNKDADAQKIALVNRIAFLYAGTTLQNLRKLFIEDLSESIKDSVLSRANEIMEKRIAIKEGRAQAKLVPKSDL
jgi:hypothetical protein